MSIADLLARHERKLEWFNWGAEAFKVVQGLVKGIRICFELGIQEILY
jgi:hypothetical protein